ncbi:MAG TPA: DNA methyltransferase [Amaricoccus sp.]|uniref:site-specific DNA-methyltransferase n=1 Tax=Amaricoccus sp. TaxID=1872485 RepID=UPI002CB15365|nr:DNA methyltransferase [Amaricoccus sp.]HMQ92168.1 DNA methyltransferase [Amaricoccus sp.]HMR36562.1 DNA methyltransferase [Paracoccus sp. (in: a-proteobacteria)]HMR53446.1 DNA methyltransferase [Amaricoccus sp.]HMU00427.1 DNA methyltransferase [Amaricoccus sp.]
MPVRLHQIETPEPLAIDHRPVDALIPYARNARTHSEDQVALIAGSIREFGFTTPVLVDGGNGIIAGHGRVLAARKLGMVSVPVIELGHLSAAQRRAYVLADNRLAEAAGWDRELLALEVAELDALGVDLGTLGFEAGEIDALLRDGVPDPREEATPEPPAVPVSRPGDLWVLGPHRLLCGSSTEAADVARLLGGLRPHLTVTDPPYGVAYDPSWRNAAGLSATKRTGRVLNDDRADWREAWALFPGEVAYVWHGALHAAEVAASLEASGFAVRSQIIWAKERLVLSRGDYHWQHEPCWYAVRRKGRGHWAGDRKQTTLWTIPSREQDAATVHGTQKPVEAMRRPMLNNSSPGQAVYEPFCGSGTSIIAAETCGRSCLALELDPAYVDVAVTRWQDFTEEVAVLEADGRGFAEIATMRSTA